jgi:hypothetical protein
MKKKTGVTKAGKRQTSQFPRGWNQKRVQAVIDYYDKQTDEEGALEYEAGMLLQERATPLRPKTRTGKR